MSVQVTSTQHDLNLEMLHQLLGSYKPDLNIVCEDEETIKTYKLLLGLLSKQMGDIFLHEDFVTESETTVIVPIHSQQMKLKSVTEGTEPPDALSRLFMQIKQSLQQKNSNFQKVSII